MLPNGPHVHVEGPGAAGQSLSNPAVAENAERCARELRPGRRRRDRRIPLAGPHTPAQARVEPSEAPGQCQHRADHELGDAHVVTVRVGQQGAGRQRRAVDAIEAGARNLHQLQLPAGGTHLRAERHGHQDVHVGEPGDDTLLVVDDDVERQGQEIAHRRLEARGEGSGEGNPKPWRGLHEGLPPGRILRVTLRGCNYPGGHLAAASSSLARQAS